MSIERLAAALDECLRAMADGASLEQVLARYPRQANELRPLLAAALHARSIGGPSPASAAAARSRARLVAAARSSHRTRAAGLILVPRLRTALASLAVAGALALGGGGSLLASAKALPGDALYRLKIFRERTRISLTSDAAKRLDLERAYDQERVNEVEVLIAHARSAEVDFAGALTERADGEWIVAGLRVVVLPGVPVADDLVVGAYVEVHGVPMPDGSVLAERIRSHDLRLEGRLEFLSAERWVVQGVVLSLGPQSEVRGAPSLGDTLRVRALRLANGALLVRTAEVVRRAGPTRTPSSPPILPATPSPEDDTEPTEVEEAQETQETPEIEATQDGEHLDEATETPRPTRTTEPDETPEPEKTSKPTKSPEPTDDD